MRAFPAAASALDFRPEAALPLVEACLALVALDVFALDEALFVPDEAFVAAGEDDAEPRVRFDDLALVVEEAAFAFVALAVVLDFVAPFLVPTAPPFALEARVPTVPFREPAPFAGADDLLWEAAASVVAALVREDRPVVLFLLAPFCCALERLGVFARV